MVGETSKTKQHNIEETVSAVVPTSLSIFTKIPETIDNQLYLKVLGDLISSIFMITFIGIGWTDKIKFCLKGRGKFTITKSPSK